MNSPRLLASDLHKMKYNLEIYMPDNPGYDYCFHAESDTPFQTFQKGDLVIPSTWAPHWAGYLDKCFPETGALLKVTGIKHFIVQLEDFTITSHTIALFTTAIPNTAKAQLEAMN